MGTNFQKAFKRIPLVEFDKKLKKCSYGNLHITNVTYFSFANGDKFFKKCPKTAFFTVFFFKNLPAAKHCFAPK